MKIYIANSKIHGQGVFAGKNFQAGEKIGVAVTNIKPFIRTKIGEMINHSDKSNSIIKENSGFFILFASKNINKFSEITLDYNHWVCQ